MKKKNYVRPLAEVVELDAQDIITTSPFSDNVNGGIVGEHTHQIEESLPDYVKVEVVDGNIVIANE